MVTKDPVYHLKYIYDNYRKSIVDLYQFRTGKDEVKEPPYKHIKSYATFCEKLETLANSLFSATNNMHQIGNPEIV